jgi:hypothetical protein
MKAYGDLTVFECGKPVPRCAEPACGERATEPCQFELRGKRAGERCGRLLCPRCAHRCGSVVLCGPHSRVTG